jgi:hypothetical protein
VQTLLELSQVFASLSGAHTQPEEMRSPPPIHCKVIFAQ